jgi:hypothetical protein
MKPPSKICCGAHSKSTLVAVRRHAGQNAALKQITETCNVAAN